MRDSCIHTHTDFCDGKGSVDDFCRSALEKDMAALGFSAHAPARDKIRYQTDWHLAPENFQKYKEQVLKAREAYRPLEIFWGLEVDYIKNYISPADADIQGLGLDYIIGSVHWVLPPGAGINWPAGLLPIAPCVDGSEEDFEFLLKKGFGGDIDALISAYFDAEIEMCAKGGFEVLGHCDLIKKNNKNERYFSESGKTFLENAEQLARALSKTNIIVEVNTGGMNRGKTQSPYPSVEILKIFKSYNIPAMVNADAHSPADLCGNYDVAKTALRAAGYKSVPFTELLPPSGFSSGRPSHSKQFAELGKYVAAVFQ